MIFESRKSNFYIFLGATSFVLYFLYILLFEKNAQLIVRVILIAFTLVFIIVGIYVKWTNRIYKKYNSNDLIIVTNGNTIEIDIDKVDILYYSNDPISTNKCLVVVDNQKELKLYGFELKSLKNFFNSIDKNIELR